MIPLPSLLFLILGFASAKVMTKDFLAPFLDFSGGVLLPYLLVFVGFLVSLRGGKTVVAERQRFFVILVTTLLLVGMVTWRQALVRMNNFSRIHDGAIQSEVAADFLLHGKNPYTEDFRYTPFGQAPSPYRPNAVNLAWTHYAYPPAVILSAVPSILVRPWLGPLSDLRWTYLGMLLAATGAIIYQVQSWRQKSLAVVLFLLNPLIWLYAVAGFNDVMAAAGLIIAGILTERRHARWAGVVMAITLGAKQTAWLAIPLWLWWLWRRRRYNKEEWRKTLTSFLATLVVLFMPFILWDASAFYDDVVRYVSGTLPFAYPISGSTFLQFLRIFHIVDSPWTIIPTWPLQLAAACVSGWIGWRWIRKEASAASWLTGVVIMTLSVAMVSRFFNDNYLSAIVTIATAAYLLHHDRETAE